MTNRARGSLWLYVLFALSGAAGLGYQMVWVRMLAAGLGHETPAMLGVASAFLGGLAVGGWCLDGRVARVNNPARWFAGIEMVIAVTGLATALTIPWVNHLALQLAGPAPTPLLQWLIVFLLPFLTLLPTTAAMGATFPTMERFLGRLNGGKRCVGAIYAANTFGAVLGTLASVFVLMPALGFRGSLVVLGAMNVMSALIAWSGFARVSGSVPKNAGRMAGATTGRAGNVVHAVWLSRRRGFVTLFFTGWLGIGFQFVVVRGLSQVLENTVYTYASALAVYLVGTAVGAALYQRWSSAASGEILLGRLLVGLSIACGGGLLVLHQGRTIYSACRASLGDSLPGTVLGESLVTASVLLVPALLMGAIFSHLVQALRREDGGVGRAGAVNTFGCALAGTVGVLVIPSLGLQWAAVILSGAYLLLIPRMRPVAISAVVALALLAVVTQIDLRMVDRLPGADVIAYRDGVMASVAVVKTADGHRSLRVNNRLQMGGTAAAMAERRQAHLPVLLHPSPRRALFLGPGTGITLGAASAYPGLIVDGVELIPEVVTMMPHFAPENEGPLPKGEGRLWAADARRFVRTTTNRYDVIVADLFHPAHDGAGFLYTREHFQAVRERLAPGGLFCQWLPLHQLDEAVLQSIVRTFLDTFSETRAFVLHFNVDIPALALVGTTGSPEFSATAFETRLGNPDVRTRLRGVGLDRFINLAGCFVADAVSLRRFAGDAPLSTDDRPVVLFAAPRFAVRREVRTEAVLLALLEKCRADERAIAKSGFDAGNGRFVTELLEFLAARDVYLNGLVKEGAGDLAGAVEAYLESARRSLSFTPGYARCVTIIQVMAQTDRARAEELFRRLEAAQPAQPLGRRLLGPLFEAQTEQ